MGEKECAWCHHPAAVRIPYIWTEERKHDVKGEPDTVQIVEVQHRANLYHCSNDLCIENAAKRFPNNPRYLKCHDGW